MAGLVGIGLATAASSADTVVYGPRTYTGTGRPALKIDSFTVGTGGGGYTLHVANEGVQLGLVILNGRIVLRPADFSDPPQRTGRDDDPWTPEWDRMRRDWRPDRDGRTVATIDKPVSLVAGKNEILVAFISRINTSFTLQITGVATAPRPTIAAIPSPAPNVAGWNNSNVTVSFGCTNATSCPSPVTVTTEGANQVVSGTATGPGGSSTAQVTLNVDKTPPVVIATPAPAANAAGWNNAPVTVTFAATDALSGIASGSLTPAVTLSADGANQAVTGQARDLAGNVGTVVRNGINIDQTTPTITVALDPPPNVDGIHLVPVTAHFTCADAVSGIADCPSDQVITVNGSNQTVSGTARDTAGNSASVTSAPFSLDLHAIGVVSANPRAVPAGASTLVLVTAAAVAQTPVDPAHSAANVQLLRYDGTGHRLANLGPMFDDGTHGDQVAFDGVFTTTTTIDELAPGAVFLRVSGAFDNQDSLSGPLLVPVVGSDSAPAARSELANSLRAGNRIAAYTRLGASFNDLALLDPLPASALTDVANALSTCTVTKSVAAFEVCAITALFGGQQTPFEFFSFRDVFGVWRVISW